QAPIDAPREGTSSGQARAGGGVFASPGSGWGGGPRSTAVPVRDRRPGYPGGERVARRTFGTLAAVAVLALAACSGGSSGGGSKGEIEVWSSLPRQGSSTGPNSTIVNSVHNALAEKNNTAGGYTI